MPDFMKLYLEFWAPLVEDEAGIIDKMRDKPHNVSSGKDSAPCAVLRTQSKPSPQGLKGYDAQLQPAALALASARRRFSCAVFLWPCCYHVVWVL